MRKYFNWLVVLSSAFFISYYYINDVVSDDVISIGDIDKSGLEININHAFLLYECLEKYSEEFDVPKYIAYNIAYKETGYRGPFHISYIPSLVSSAGALGSMQIMPSTANMIYGQRVEKHALLHDIDLNVRISMMLIRRLHDKYNNWAIVCGAYNTGRPIVNGYAEYCSSNRDYKNKWVDIK